MRSVLLIIHGRRRRAELTHRVLSAIPAELIVKGTRFFKVPQKIRFKQQSVLY